MFINTKKALSLIFSILDPWYNGSAPTVEQLNSVLHELGVSCPEDEKSSFWGRALIEAIERDYTRVTFANGEYHLFDYDDDGEYIDLNTPLEEGEEAEDNYYSGI